MTGDEQVLVGLDALDRASGRLDQRILDLLGSADDGLSTDAITRIVRRRRQNVRMTLRLMEQAKQIERVHGRWRLIDG